MEIKYLDQLPVGCTYSLLSSIVYPCVYLQNSSKEKRLIAPNVTLDTNNLRHYLELYDAEFVLAGARLVSIGGEHSILLDESECKHKMLRVGVYEVHANSTVKLRSLYLQEYQAPITLEQLAKSVWDTDHLETKDAVFEFLGVKVPTIDTDTISTDTNNYRNETYMMVAETLASRSRCNERKVGCVLVYDDKPGIPMIVSEGINGTKPGEQNGDINPSHAEQNCLDKLKGKDPLFDLSRCSMYVTCRPCAKCTEELIKAGVHSVYFRDTQPEMSHLEDLKASGCKVTQLIK